MSRKKKTFVRVNRYHRYSDDYSSVVENESIEILVDISKYVGFHVCKKGYNTILNNYMVVYFDTHIPSLQQMIIDMPSFERLKQFVTEI